MSEKRLEALVMGRAADRIEALEARCEKLREAASLTAGWLDALMVATINPQVHEGAMRHAKRLRAALADEERDEE